MFRVNISCATLYTTLCIYIVYTCIVCMYVCTELCLSWPGYCARRFLLKFSIIACDLLAQNVPGNCNLLCGHLGTHTLALIHTHTLAHRQACLLPYIFIWLTLSIIAGITRGPNKLVARLKCKTNKQQTYRCCRHKETPVYECVCASMSECECVCYRTGFLICPCLHSH